jgi:hypothetical protein
MLTTLGALVVALFLAACARRETEVESGTRAQILHKGIGADPNDLDPQLVSLGFAAGIYVVGQFEAPGIAQVKHKLGIGAPKEKFSGYSGNLTVGAEDHDFCDGQWSFRPAPRHC